MIEGGKGSGVGMTVVCHVSTVNDAHKYSILKVSGKSKKCCFKYYFLVYFDHREH